MSKNDKTERIDDDYHYFVIKFLFFLYTFWDVACILLLVRLFII